MLWLCGYWIMEIDAQAFDSVRVIIFEGQCCGIRFL